MHYERSLIGTYGRITPKNKNDEGKRLLWIFYTKHSDVETNIFNVELCSPICPPFLISFVTFVYVARPDMNQNRMLKFSFTKHFDVVLACPLFAVRPNKLCQLRVSNIKDMSCGRYIVFLFAYETSISFRGLNRFMMFKIMKNRCLYVGALRRRGIKSS